MEAQRAAEAKREEVKEAAAREAANKSANGGGDDAGDAADASADNGSKARQSRHEQALAEAAKLETGGEGDTGDEVR